MIIRTPKFSKGERVTTILANESSWLSGVIVSIRLIGTNWKYSVIVEDDKDKFRFTFDEKDLSRE